MPTMFIRVRRFASASLGALWNTFDELMGLLYLPVSIIPGTFGWRLRALILGRKAVLGKNVMIDEFVRIDKPERLEIGDSSFVGRSAFIHAGGGVRIGRDVLIGPGVKVWSVDHCFSERMVPIRQQGHEFAQVVIGDDVWIGVDSVILKGVTVGHGAVVGAGSVVTKDVEAFGIVGGVPARVIGSR